jgi:hypothetical protein
MSMTMPSIPSSTDPIALPPAVRRLLTSLKKTHDITLSPPSRSTELAPFVFMRFLSLI